MHLAKTVQARVAALTLVLALCATTAQAVTVIQERVPGGALERTWLPGFGVGRTFAPLVMAPADPAFANPSGDHSVAVLTNNAVGLGGIAVAATDPLGNADYSWEGYFFTGLGDTRRGLIVRADPSNGFQTFYQLVINPGLFQLRFRKFVGGGPLPDLASWFLNTLPAGVPLQNTWHHLRIIAVSNQFRCFFDGIEMNTTPIVDNSAPILTGWVGAFNFSASTGEVPTYFDDLTLGITGAVPTRTTSWSAVKKLFR